MDTPSPAEAREALAQARQVRLNTAGSLLRTPWWPLAVLGATIVAFGIACDFGGSTAPMFVALGTIALNVAYLVAWRRSPRFAAAAGGLHVNAVPWSALRTMLLIALVVGTVLILTGPAVFDMLTESGMPAWIRDHPYTTLALASAAISVGGGRLAAVLMSRMLRRKAAR